MGRRLSNVADDVMVGERGAEKIGGCAGGGDDYLGAAEERVGAIADQFPRYAYTVLQVRGNFEYLDVSLAKFTFDGRPDA